LFDQAPAALVAARCDAHNAGLIDAEASAGLSARRNRFLAIAPSFRARRRGLGKETLCLKIGWRGTI
jgi:hypothetical protein